MKRKVLIPILVALCVPFMAGCNKASNVVDGVEFETEEEKKGPRLLDGAIDSIQIGESIILKEIIDTTLSKDFTVKLVDPSGTEIDGNKYIDRPYKPTTPGEYKIVYTINSGNDAGTATFPLKVVVKKIKWSYTLQNKPYLYGESLVFEDYFNDLNSFVDSYYPHKFVMDSVTIDDVETDLHNKTEYKIESMSDHLFKFHVESQDGQKIDASENISIKYINQNYLEEIKSKNISLYGELLVGDMNDPDDKSITLKRGQYNNGSTNFLSAKVGPHDLPYMVMNGQYGVGDLVKIDFTGNNMPIMSFFRDNNYSNNVFDESKGCVISNGFYNNFGGEVSPAVSARVSQYGPFMLYGYCDRDFLGDSSTGTVAKPFGASSANLSKLDPDNQYRLLCGFTGISKTEKDTFLTHEFALLDLTNHTLLGKYKASSYSINRIGTEVRKLPEGSYDFPLDWYKGNIVLYGNYGKTTKIDNCPEVVNLNGRTFDKVLEEDCGYVSSTFASNAPTNLSVNKEYEPSVFGDVSKAGAKVFITDMNGTDVPLVEGKIKIANPGLYKANYTDGTNFVVTKDIYVSPHTPQTEGDNVLYNAIKNDDNSYTLHKGFVSDGGTSSDLMPSYLTANDLSYIMLKDDYTLNDYLHVRFKGNNMPVMSFFRDEATVSGSLFDNSKGVVVMGGMYKDNGEYASPAISQNIHMYGPTLFYNYFDRDYFGDSPSGVTSTNPYPGSQQYLAEHDQDILYEVIVGFSAYDENQHMLTLEYRLLDITNNSELAKFQGKSYNIHLIGSNVRHLDYSFINADYFKGKIALYGNYGKSLTIDSFEVNKSSNIDALVADRLAGK